MNRNIEAGCLCLSFDPVKRGECRPLRLFPIGMEISGIKNGIQVVEKVKEDCWHVVFGDGENWYIGKRYLIRIDNHDTSADEFEAERDNELEKTK